MKTVSIHSKSLLKMFWSKKIVTKEEIKNELGTDSRATMHRKLSELKYISSFSHGGKYYTLMRIARFDDLGLWFYKSTCFSKYGSLLETILNFVDESERGYAVAELENELKVRVANPLLILLKRQQVCRVKCSGVYVYYSKKSHLKKKQELFRSESLKTYTPLKEPDMLMNELKASLVLFFSLLDEQQRRIFVGLESLKHGYGGDRLIAGIFGVTEKTVARGRGELLDKKIFFGSIRKAGGGRKAVQKKTE